jgi:hypothetical protein
MGHISSVGQRVLERLDAEVSETDDDGRPIPRGKVAVVGNEDGAHHTTAEAFQAHNDVGFTIPAQGAPYWNGRESTPSTTAAVARNAARLARALKASQYPPYPS